VVAEQNVVRPISLSDAAGAFDVGRHSHIALVGGGGKSTLMHALATQAGGRVVMTCTTKMGSDQHWDLPVLIGPTDDQVVTAAASGTILVWSQVDDHKAVGVAPERCDAWFERVDHVIIEADGSHRKPFKAPAGYEPIVPVTATLVISVIGADALGQMIADGCHRPERLVALVGCRQDAVLEPWMAATVILHEHGAAKAVPPGAELAVAINKVDDINAALVDQLVDELKTRQPQLRVVSIRRSD
jgi:probable selenium-dependent hydroxylase accessory protein YqeC